MKKICVVVASRANYSSIKSVMRAVNDHPDLCAERAFTPWTDMADLMRERGVPLFNDGQTEACATIYEVTIEAMLAFGAERLGRDVVQRLEMGLAEADAEHNSSARAWAYRRALDDAYARLTSQAELTTTASR